MEKRQRSWFFTLNNYKKEDIHNYTQILSNSEYIFQEEKGKNGTPHLQGCIRFKNGKSFSAVKKLLGNKPHIEPCRNWKHSKMYCCKEDTRNGAIYTNIKRELVAEVPITIRNRMIELMVNRMVDSTIDSFEYQPTMDPPPVSITDLSDED